MKKSGNRRFKYSKRKDTDINIDIDTGKDKKQVRRDVLIQLCACRQKKILQMSLASP